MNARILVISALLLTAPVLSHANEDAAMNACVKAFVSSSLEKERPYTVKTQESVVSPVDQYTRAYRIALSAKGKTSGKQVAKATCVVDRSGVVLALNGKPYAAPVAGEEAVLSAR
jgi:hypothetical protein